MVSLLVVAAPKVARTTGREHFVVEVFEQSSDRCPKRSVDMWHINGGHFGRLLGHPVSFRAHCGVPTFLVLSLICDGVS